MRNKREVFIIAKVKVEVLDAIVDGKVRGEQLEVDEKSAKQLEANGYVKVVKDAPKSKPRSSSAKKSEDK